MPHYNLENIPAKLLAALITGLLLVVILRILFQVLRVDFRNPMVQTVIGLTDSSLQFLRRFIPGIYGVDLAPPVLFTLLCMARVSVPPVLSGQSVGVRGVIVVGIAEGLIIFIWILIFAVLARVVLSWVAPRSRHHLAELVGEVSEPLMAVFRRFLPAFGGLDFSPVLCLLALRLLQNFALHPLVQLGAQWL